LNDTSAARAVAAVGAQNAHLALAFTRTLICRSLGVASLGIARWSLKIEVVVLVVDRALIAEGIPEIAVAKLVAVAERIVPIPIAIT
jgi:hypothetical protein